MKKSEIMSGKLMERKDKEGELVDMEEAIAYLKTTRPTFYRWLRSGRIKGMKIGRQWRFYRSDLDRFLRGQDPQIALTADLSPLIDALNKKAAELGIKLATTKPEEDISPLAPAVELIIVLAAKMRASSIHIASQVRSGQDEPLGSIRIRIDGVLHLLAEFDNRLQRAIVERWKIMANCDLHETAKPQDGRIQINVEGKKLDLRIAFVPTVLGEALTVRILDANAVKLDFESMPFNSGDKEKIRSNLRTPWGIVLCTGPAGSGKTTTLYSCLNLMNTPSSNLISIEDPVEYLLPGVTQIPLRPGQGLTFAGAMRSVLRQDPDIIMVGEIRDQESLMMMQEAALTGHLVLSTLHTENAAAALQRMIEIGVPPFLVADSTRMVIAQRLLRVLCPKCKRPVALAPDLLASAERLARKGGLDWDRMEKNFHEAVGCAECRQTGFRGRTLAAEVLEMTPQIGEALRRAASVDELQSVAISQGMTSMAADGVRRAALGQTTLSEVFRILPIH